MTELHYKEGDKLLVNEDIDSFCKGDVVTVIIDDSASDPSLPYFVSNGDFYAWISARELNHLSLSVEGQAPISVDIPVTDQTLDLNTVNHIHSYYTNIIQQATEADATHKEINIAFLGYIEGLQEGLSNG